MWEPPYPDCFTCPITRERLKDPVVAADGHSYERSAIERWMPMKPGKAWVSPLTGLSFRSRDLRANHALRKAMDELTSPHHAQPMPKSESRAIIQQRAKFSHGLMVATIAIVGGALAFGTVCGLGAATAKQLAPPSAPRSALWYGAVARHPQPPAGATSWWGKIHEQSPPQIPAAGEDEHASRGNPWSTSMLILAGVTLCGSGLAVDDDGIAIALVFAGAPLACVSFVLGIACATGDSEASLFLSRCLLIIGFLFCAIGVHLTRQAEKESSIQSKPLQSSAEA